MALDLLLRRLIRRSDDLRYIWKDGYVIDLPEMPGWLSYDWLYYEINRNYWFHPRYWITVSGIPYVSRREPTSEKSIQYGELVMPLWVVEGRTVQPREHWAVWHGGVPHFSDGVPRMKILAPKTEGSKIPEQRNPIFRPYNVHVLSSSPNGVGGLFDDLFNKVVYYEGKITSQAKEFDSNARTWKQKNE